MPFQKGHQVFGGIETRFKKGNIPWTKGLKGFMKGHPVYGGFQKGNQISKGQIPWNKELKGFVHKGSYQKGHKRNNGENHPLWGKHRTEEEKRKMRGPRLSMRGKNHPHYGQPPPRGKGAYYKGIWMRSGWEIRTAQWLDKHNIKWLYENKRFILKDRTYCPDFYLPDRNIWWEIKGWFNKRDQETIRQFREFYPKEKLVVLTKPIYEAMIKGAN